MVVTIANLRSIRFKSLPRKSVIRTCGLVDQLGNELDLTNAKICSNILNDLF